MFFRPRLKGKRKKYKEISGHVSPIPVKTRIKERKLKESQSILGTSTTEIENQKKKLKDLRAISGCI